MKKILIGIQARSTSTRLPGKACLSINGKPMLRHVIDACQSAARYVTRQRGVDVKTVLLIPENDQIKFQFTDIDIVEGSESDVLSRYVKAAEIYNADYIARVTGDCWAMAPHALSRAIKSMLILSESRDVNFVTNADVTPLFEREVKEGYDAQVLSRKLLLWLNTAAVDIEDREHVCTLIGKEIATGRFLMKWAFLGDNIAPSSIDTYEQYSAVIDAMKKKKEKINKIMEYNGIYVD